MVDEACKQESSPVSAGVDALPVECPAPLLEEICQATLAECDSQPHMTLEFNGPLFGRNLDINYRVPFHHKRVEVCGVLFGSREETRVQIRDFRRLVLGDDFEQSATLSERERQALAALIAGTKTDPALPGIEPVGWLRSDAKNHLTLSRRDLEIFHYFFNEPWQIALMLRPGRSAPAKARFILRKADGSICRASAIRDVIVPATAESPIVRVERERPATQADGARPAPAPRTWHPPRARKATARSSFSWILGVVLAGGYWWMKSSPQTSLQNAGKRTPAAAVDGRKKVEQDAAALWKKWEAELGRQQEVAAPTEKLETQPPTAPTTPDAFKELPAAERFPQKASTIGERFKEREPQVRPGKEPVRKALERPRTMAAAPRRAAAPVLHDAKRYGPPKPLIAPPAVEKKVLAQALTPPPQLAHQEAPVTQLLQEQPALPAPPVQPPPVPEAAKNPASASPAVTVAPTSGRLLWTGHLQKNQTLTIDGTSASTGSFTGELPGKPIHLKIWPGNLADDGIVMYTSIAKGASPVYEAPGPQNGWNRTLYTLNPRRAAEILLVEPPGPQNGWKRLVLRSKSQTASVILVEWTAAP